MQVTAKYFNSLALAEPAKREWFKIAMLDDDETEIMIYNDIGYFGVTASDFVSQLNAIKTPKISLRINSNGGEAFEAFAIFNAIKNHSATVTVHVDGIAASAASVIALAGDKVCIAKNAYLMIHNVSVGCYGNADYLRKQADIIDKMSTGIAQTYADKSGKPLDEIKKALNEETWLNAQEALDFGLVDEIDDGEEDDDMPEAMARALMKFNKAPENLRKIAAKFIENRGSGVPAPSHPHKKEPIVAEKVISRDGKHFVKVDGKELEIDMPTASAAAVVENPVAVLTPEAAAAAAVTKERTYRKEFMTALASSGLTGTAATEFEEKFYGKDMDIVKFVAANSIATRAKAVGEASETEGQGAAAKPGDPAIAAYKAAETARFKADSELRRMWRLAGNEPEDSENYKAALNRFLTQQMKYMNQKMV